MFRLLAISLSEVACSVNISSQGRLTIRLVQKRQLTNGGKNIKVVKKIAYVPVKKQDNTLGIRYSSKSLRLRINKSKIQNESQEYFSTPCCSFSGFNSHVHTAQAIQTSLQKTEKKNSRRSSHLFQPDAGVVSLTN